METPETPISITRFQSRHVVQIVLQLLALAVLLRYCYNVLSPFINPIIWGSILAVSLYPLHHRLKSRLKGNGVIASVLLITALLSIIILPAIWLSIRTAEEVGNVIDAYRAGNIVVPLLPDYVKEWPVVGAKISELWSQASTGLGTLIEKHPEQVKSITSVGIDLLASTGKGLVLFGLSILVSGVFLTYSEQASKFATTFFSRLLNSTKFDLATIAAVTIRNVVKGVLGVAVIQTALFGVGLLVAGVPYAGIWILICLIFEIIQVGILPLSIGAIIYIWSVGTTTTAVLLTIWLVIISFVDNLLTPMLMGKGAPVPMIVIFVGSLGGFLYSGFMGLFIGAVILSLGYKLFDVWLKELEI